MKLKSDIPRYGTGNEDTDTTEPGVRLIFLNFPNCDCNAMLDQDKHIELPPTLAPTLMFTYECTRDFSSVINVKIVIFIHWTKFQFWSFLLPVQRSPSWLTRIKLSILRLHDGEWPVWPILLLLGVLCFLDRVKSGQPGHCHHMLYQTRKWCFGRLQLAGLDKSSGEKCFSLAGPDPGGVKQEPAGQPGWLEDCEGRGDWREITNNWGISTDGFGEVKTPLFYRAIRGGRG